MTEEHNKTTRRSFLTKSVSTALMASSLPAMFAESNAVDVGIGPLTGNTMAPDFNGFSYETLQLSDPTFFSASNHDLISLFRQLTPHGVLRIGGNSSEFCWWKTSESQTPPPNPILADSDSNYMPHSVSAIGPAGVDALVGFLDKTGWKCIYGLNLGRSTPARAAEEATYVANALGPRLIYFQIGNEPEFYKDSNNMLRGKDWDFDKYLTEWLTFAHAVLDRVPGAVFGGPDVGSDASWVIRFAEQAPKRLPGRIVAATGHYYAEGPPESPNTTIARLLSPDPKVTQSVSAMVAASASTGIRYRMTEGNSCYRGGKPGLSNAFCSALWSADYMLTLASLGAAGVNLHGGGSKLIRFSLGGHLPGEALTPDGPRIAAEGSFYTPIAGSRETGFYARPVFYGMRLAETLAGAQLRSVSLDLPKESVTAYAGDLQGGGTRVVFINKDERNDASVRIAASGPATLWRLTAPAMDATKDVRLGGQGIRPGSTWEPTDVETIRSHAGRVVVKLPRASATVLTIAHAKAYGE